ncbi:ABC transporter substrate-binding protein [Nocardioides sp. GCM10027113]|uniref:ABC transporter substrate-binding protein n=1 Tax=unclassified Nocardioides TaxID=2615069 RepID=UPI00360C2F5B
MKSRQFVAALLSAVGLSAVAACSGESSAGGAGPAADTSVLTVASSASVTTWDPVKSFSTEAMYLGNLYEPLLWKNPAGSAEEYTPAIATGWEVSEDGLTWTFDIREGVTFHTGETVDAAAVKASLDAARERAGASFIWAPVEKISTPDEMTVELQLGYAAPVDLIASSTYGAWIVAPSMLEKAEKDEKFFESGVDGGTGPYTLASYTAGEKVVLERYEDYWNEERMPTYETVDIAITSDAVTAQQMLTTGEVDYSTQVPLENVSTFESNDDYNVKVSKSPFNFLALFNTTRPPLDDPQVRQALSWAIPYEDIIQVGGQGYGTQAHGPVPDGIFPFSEEVPQYSQDLDKAKDLLAEAGHADGFDLTLTYASENAAEDRFVPLIKDAFAQIGVDVTVKAQLFNQQWEEAKADPAKAQDIFVLYYWPTYSDAGSDNLYSLFHSSDVPFFNLSYWKNEKYDALIDEAATLTATDRDQAQALYVEAMELLHEEAPGAFLYDAQAVSVVPSGLETQEFNENYPFTTFFAGFRPA